MSRKIINNRFHIWRIYVQVDMYEKRIWSEWTRRKIMSTRNLEFLNRSRWLKYHLQGLRHLIAPRAIMSSFHLSQRCYPGVDNLPTSTKIYSRDGHACYSIYTHWKSSHLKNTHIHLDIFFFNLFFQVCPVSGFPLLSIYAHSKTLPIGKLFWNPRCYCKTSDES